MKTEVKVFAALVPFFLLVSAIYAYFTNFSEWVGIIGLFLTAMAAAWIAVYLWLQGRRTDPRPEDNPVSDVDEHAGELGVYSPHSWWPLVLGFAVALVFAGVAVGWWMVGIGFAVALIGLVGQTYEFSRGPHAH